jgi:hypothetical protein
MTKRSQVEIERKYDVDESAVPPRLVGAGPVALESDPETAELVAVYFDTPGLELARNRIALRVRHGGGDAGWTVKLPGDEGRTELSWPLGAAEGAQPGSEPPPAEVVDAVREYIGDAPLEPLARVTNTRVTVILQDAAGFAIAELCDDHVRSEGLRGPQEPSSARHWREWEVELLEAAPDTRERRTALLDDIEARLLEAGARPSTSSSKLARALGVDALGS